MRLYTAFILLYFTETDEKHISFNFQLSFTTASDPL